VPAAALPSDASAGGWHLFKEGPSSLEGGTSWAAVGLCVLGDGGDVHIRVPWGAEMGIVAVVGTTPIVAGEACCPLGPGPKQESPWGCFRGMCLVVGWGHCGLVDCYRVGVPGKCGGDWGWCSGRLEGPGGSCRCEIVGQGWQGKM